MGDFFKSVERLENHVTFKQFRRSLHDANSQNRAPILERLPQSNTGKSVVL
jgi:hypothetical protein